MCTLLQLEQPCGCWIRTILSHGACRASDKCQRERRKTVNGDDLLWAMTTLGFDDYIEPLKAYLAKFRDAEKRALAANATAANKGHAAGEH